LVRQYTLVQHIEQIVYVLLNVRRIMDE